MYLKLKAAPELVEHCADWEIVGAALSVQNTEDTNRHGLAVMVVFNPALDKALSEHTLSRDEVSRVAVQLVHITKTCLTELLGPPNGPSGPGRYDTDPIES